MTTHQASPVPSSIPTEIDVKIDDLKFDPKLQTRAKPHDRQYVMGLCEVIRERGFQDSIVVFRDPTDGSQWVADGHARADAARSAGCATIRARVHEGGLREAFEFALGANATHGVRRTNADLRHTVLTALADPGTKTYTNEKIADLCHCSDHYVGVLRNKLAATSGNPAEARRTGKDGKSYPARRPRKAAVPTRSKPARSSSVAVSPPQTRTDSLASTDGAAGSSIAITKGVPTEASHDGLSAEVTTPTNSTHVIHEVVGVIPVEPPAALLGEGPHVVATPSEGEPTAMPTDATVVSTPEDVIPSITIPSALGEDEEALLGQLLSICAKIHARRQRQPEVTVREDLVRAAREKVARCLDECYPDTRDTVHGKLTNAPARFYEMMGYNPRPGHGSDEAILGVLSAEIDQERLTT